MYPLMLPTSDSGDEDSESDASSFPMSEEEEEQKKAPKQAEPKKGQRGRKRRTEPIVVTREDGTREEVSPQVYRRLRRWACFCWQFGEVMLCVHEANELSLVLILCMPVMEAPNVCDGFPRCSQSALQASHQ